MNRLAAAALLSFLAGTLTGQDAPASRPTAERAEALLKEGKHDEAVEVLRAARAAASAAEAPACDVNLARGLLRRAQVRRAAGQDAAAYHDADESVAIAPEEMVNRVQRAAWWREDGETFRALREVERVVEKHPRAFEAREALARCREDDDDLPGALEAVVAAKELNPARAAVYDPWEAKLRKDIAYEATWFRVARGAFTVKGEDRAFGALAEPVLDMLDAAAQRCGATLGHIAGRRVVVVLYGRSTFRDATGVHGWAGGLFDGRIRLPVADFAENRASIARTLAHEYFHLAVQDLTRRCPLWLNEGLAQIVEGRDVGQSRARLAGPWRRMDTLPANWVSIPDAAEVSRLYAAAHVTADAMVNRVGWAAVREVLILLRNGKGVSDALEKVTGLTLADIEDGLAGPR